MKYLGERQTIIIRLPLELHFRLKKIGEQKKETLQAVIQRLLESGTREKKK